MDTNKRQKIIRIVKLAALTGIAFLLMLGGMLVHEKPLLFFGKRNINTPKHFPDPVFRKRVEHFMGVKPNQPFSEYRASIRRGKIEILGNFRNSSIFIANPQGIEYLQSLEELILGDNAITSLDLSRNKKLIKLDLRNLLISRIDLSKNENLLELSLENLRVNSIDLSHNEKLERLCCKNLNLTVLDISKNPNLWNLNCSNNKLTKLDLSNANDLHYLDCSFNQLQQINVSNIPQLQNLLCNDNFFTKLDLTKNPRLYALNCDNNKINTILLDSHPNLTYIYINNNQIDTLKPFLSLPALESFNCLKNPLTAEGMKDIEALKKKIEKITVDANTDEQIIETQPLN